VLDPCEEIGKRIFAARGAGSEEDFIRVFEPESDGVAVIQRAALDFLAVDEESSALAAVFKVEVAGFEYDGGAIARDAPVGELQMIARFRTAANQERGLRDPHVTASAVRRHDLEDRSPHRHGSCIRHGLLATGL
jgi:hypothetical protein